MSTSSVAVARPGGRFSYLRDLWARREMAVYLALGHLRSRNASTALGLLWWVLNPLLLGGVYLVVFGIILEGRRGDPRFLAYLLSGMFVFYYTRSATTGGATSLIGNAKLMVNLRFPRLLLPISAMIEAAIGFWASMVVYLAIVGVAGQITLGRATLWLPFVFVFQTVFNFGLSALGARLAVPFRDVTNLLPYMLRFWLYLSPIIWSIDRIGNLPDVVQTVLRLNPMWSYLALYRASLLGTPVESWEAFTVVAWAIGAAVVGVWVFVRGEGSMVKYL